MQVLLLILCLLEGTPEPYVQRVGLIPDMKTCEEVAHRINTSKVPQEVNHKQLNGMGAICMRIKPPGKDT